MVLVFSGCGGEEGLDIREDGVILEEHAPDRGDEIKGYAGYDGDKTDPGMKNVSVREGAADKLKAEEPSDDSGLININTASETELMVLKGIGGKRAKAIVDYREKNGAFGNIEDIKKVSGIKEGIFKKIKDQITV